MKIIELANVSWFELELVWKDYAVLGFIQLQVHFVERHIQG